MERRALLPCPAHLLDDDLRAGLLQVDLDVGTSRSWRWFSPSPAGGVEGTDRAGRAALRVLLVVIDEAAQLARRDVCPLVLALQAAHCRRFSDISVARR